MESKREEGFTDEVGAGVERVLGWITQILVWSLTIPFIIIMLAIAIG